MLPALGGGSSLRGFSSWRFRDLNSLLLQAEWRVLANRFLDMALFYDAGRVSARRSDLRVGPLEERLRRRLPAARRAGHAAAHRDRQEQRRAARWCSPSKARVLDDCAHAHASRTARRRRLGRRADARPPRPRAARFFADDPLAREPESQDASGARPADVGLLYDIVVQPVRDVAPRRRRSVRAQQRQHDRRGARLELVHQPHPAAAASRSTSSSAARTPAPPPNPERWVITREKSAGYAPGFTAKDANGETWFVSFDSPGYARGRHRRDRRRQQDLLGPRLQPGRDLHHDGRSARRLTIDPTATMRRPNGKRTPMRARRPRRDPRARARAIADGTYRAAAGPPAAGQGARPVPLRGHAPRRPQRHRRARAPPRAARAARVRRVDEPHRPQGRQHARHAGHRRRPQRRARTTCRTSARRSASAPTARTTGTRASSTSTRASARARGCSRSASRSARGRRPTTPTTRRSAASRATRSIR